MSGQEGVELSPIGDVDRAEAGRFLHAQLNSAVSAEAWADAMRVPWLVDAPNHGFLLRADGAGIVGVYLGFYAEREIDGVPVRVCNLGAWCVLDEYRAHSIRLLRAMLGQKDWQITDLSPSGAVVPLNTRLKFRLLDTSTMLVPNLPWPPSRRVRIVTDPARIGALLAGREGHARELQIFRDHERAAAARHILIQRGEDLCYLIVRKDRRKGLPLFASVLYVSDPELFRRSARHVYRHLLVRHGALATLAEHRVTGQLARPWLRVPTPRPKMFRSQTLRPEQIDYLYSELTCVAW